MCYAYTSAYVCIRIRQHTYAYVCIRMLTDHTSIRVLICCVSINTYAYVGWRMLTSAYVCLQACVCWCVTHIRQHTYALLLMYVSTRMLAQAWRMLTYADVCWRMLTYADVCFVTHIRQHTYARSCMCAAMQHTSAYVSIRQHRYIVVRAHVYRRQHTSAYVSICQHMSAYVSIRQHRYIVVRAHIYRRQHTSAYVSIRQHTNGLGSSSASLWCGTSTHI